MSELRDGGPGPGNRVTLSRIVGAVVAVWTCLVFLPALWNGFVDWDDGRMFLENPYHRGSWAMRMRGAWATHLLGEYMPVTWTTYALDRALWDLDARGYHLTSLGLHVATTLGVYAVAGRLLALARGERLDERGRIVAAAVAALAFGVHPLRAEPVAWLSARGTVLGGCLLVLAVLAYLVGWERGRVEGRVPEVLARPGGRPLRRFDPGPRHEPGPAGPAAADRTSILCVASPTVLAELGRACDSPCPGGEAWARRSGRARDPDGLSRA